MPESLKVLDLFSGIGGFSLGLERAGMETIAFCEIDEKCRQELKKHWLNIPIYEDIKDLNVERLRRDGIEPNILCGGFPCQDISIAGYQKGLSGGRSGLWSQFARLISEIRPKYAIIENVANLLLGDRGNWFSQILTDLASIWYDAEWDVIPASAVGVNHKRERVWIVAYPKGNTKQNTVYSEIPQDFLLSCEFGRRTWGPVPGTHWATDKPRLVEMDDGVSGWVASVSQYGNAVVPQIPELIGKAILEHESRRT